MNEYVFSLLQLRNYGVEKMLIDPENGEIGKLVFLFDGAMLRSNQRHFILIFVFNG